MMTTPGRAQGEGAWRRPCKNHMGVMSRGNSGHKAKGVLSQSVLLLREGPQRLQRLMGTRLTRGLAKAAQVLSSKLALVVAVVVVVGLLRADHFPRRSQKL